MPKEVASYPGRADRLRAAPIPWTERNVLIRSTETHQLALGAGCDGYMSKPLEMTAFVAMLRAFLA